MAASGVVRGRQVRYRGIGIAGGEHDAAELALQAMTKFRVIGPGNQRIRLGQQRPHACQIFGVFTDLGAHQQRIGAVGDGADRQFCERGVGERGRCVEVLGIHQGLRLCSLQARVFECISGKLGGNGKGSRGLGVQLQPRLHLGDGAQDPHADRGIERRLAKMLGAASQQIADAHAAAGIAVRIGLAEQIEQQLGDLVRDIALAPRLRELRDQPPTQQPENEDGQRETETECRLATDEASHSVPVPFPHRRDRLVGEPMGQIFGQRIGAGITTLPVGVERLVQDRLELAPTRAPETTDRFGIQRLRQLLGDQAASLVQ